MKAVGRKPVVKGEEIVIAGEPGVGKSMFAAQLAKNLAANMHPVAVYSLEMRTRALIRRWLSEASEVSTRKMKTGRLEDGDWPKITNAVTQLSSLPIYLSDSTHWTTAKLRADLMRLKSEYGIECFLMDYFDLLKDHAEDDLTAQKNKSIALHDICADLNLAGIVVHTLSKAGMRSGASQLADVSGNRQIIYDADVVLYYTSHIPTKGQIERDNYRTVRFGKFRDEPVGKKMFDLQLAAGGVPKLLSVSDLDSPVSSGTVFRPEAYEPPPFLDDSWTDR